MEYPQPNAPYSPQLSAKRRFGAISALFLSFFSGALYRDVAQRWRGCGFWYLVLLLIVTWTPFAIYAQHGMKKFVHTDAPAAVQGFPSITIKDGQASIAEPEPYLWKDPQTGQVLLYVDTTGAFDLPEGKDAKMKLSKTKLDIKKNAVETQSINFIALPWKSIYIDKATLLNWLDQSSHWVGFLIMAWGLTGALIYHLVQILIFAGIGMAIASSSTKLSYGAMMRLTAVAITPAMILSVFADLVPVLNGCGVGVLYLVIEWVAIALAIKANKIGQAGPPGGFPAYPPGYGARPGGYPQQPPMPPQMPPPPRY